MNKKDLIEFIFERLGKKISRKVISDVINGFMDSILTSVENGDSVKLVGFMNFNLKHYAERMTRNPKTGKVSQTPSSVKVSAKLGALFKKASTQVDIAKFIKNNQ